MQIKEKTTLLICQSIYRSKEVCTCMSAERQRQGCEFLSPTAFVNPHAVSLCPLSAISQPVNSSKYALCSSSGLKLTF